jgi:hypothetical protein
LEAGEPKLGGEPGEFGDSQVDPVDWVSSTADASRSVLDACIASPLLNRETHGKRGGREDCMTSDETGNRDQ